VPLLAGFQFLSVYRVAPFLLVAHLIAIVMGFTLNPSQHLYDLTVLRDDSHFFSISRNSLWLSVDQLSVFTILLISTRSGAFLFGSHQSL
jgi:hypothetical protein